MNLSPSNRLTPWVGRLIIANAVVLLLLLTVFTSPSLQAALLFAPGEALHRPWTFVTYMFVHAGLLHLLGNMLMLFVFGPAVEHRLGGRAFILYYLYCGIGAAVFACSCPASWRPPRSRSWARRARCSVWASPSPCSGPMPSCWCSRCRCRSRRGPSSWCSWVSTSCSSQLTPNDGIAHLAHIGGAGFGYLFFRLQALSRRSPHPPPRAVERVVMVQSGAAEPEHRTPPAPLRPRRRAEADPVAAEVDRVLDKISEQGIEQSHRRRASVLGRSRAEEKAGALDGRDGEDTERARQWHGPVRPSCFNVVAISCVFPPLSYCAPC